jgi:hypothetical protein
MAWALAGVVLGAFLGAGFAHDIARRMRRQRLTLRLAHSGKLTKVLVLESERDEFSFHSTWRYRYLTPGGVEATDSVEGGAGGAEAWSEGDDYLLALCSEDERESVLLSASGYPLAALPARPAS